jgi:mRNA interferase HicA
VATDAEASSTAATATAATATAATATTAAATALTARSAPLGRGDRTTQVLTTHQKCCILSFVTSPEFKRWLTKQGCTFESGKGGHLIVRLGTAMSVLPMHGKGKDLGTGLVNRIKKDLGLKG